jgi:hypothetical protein
MRNRTWPITAKYTGELPIIEAHSRGGQGAGGHYNFGIGGGARVTWSLNIVPMNTGDALKFRAFLHSLRGSGGTFGITMPAPSVAGGAVSGLQGYSDTTLHSDGTPFSDTIDTSVMQLSEGTVAAASTGATALVITGFTAVAGAWMTITTAAGLQLVRVTSVSGSTATVRPALRAAVSASAAVRHGPVTGIFRLIGNPPAVPLIVTRSKGLTLECEEAY